MDESEIIENDFNILNSYLKYRMKEPIYKKRKKIVFFEFLHRKGIDEKFDFYKNYKNVKFIFNEIQSAYYEIGCIDTVKGIAIDVYYQFYSKKNITNVQNNNRSDMAALDFNKIEKFKTKIDNGKTLRRIWLWQSYMKADYLSIKYIVKRRESTFDNIYENNYSMNAFSISNIVIITQIFNRII